MTAATKPRRQPILHLKCRVGPCPTNQVTNHVYSSVGQAPPYIKPWLKVSTRKFAMIKRFDFRPAVTPRRINRMPLLFYTPNP